MVRNYHILGPFGIFVGFFALFIDFFTFDEIFEVQKGKKGERKGKDRGTHKPAASARGTAPRRASTTPRPANAGLRSRRTSQPKNHEKSLYFSEISRKNTVLPRTSAGSVVRASLAALPGGSALD